jgi:hypothetical protein
MRALSATAAAKCEQATTARCRCRCGGAYHGAARYAEPDDAYLLDADDPHLPALGQGRQLALRDLAVSSGTIEGVPRCTPL